MLNLLDFPIVASVAESGGRIKQALLKWAQKSHQLLSIRITQKTWRGHIFRHTHTHTHTHAKKERCLMCVRDWHLMLATSEQPFHDPGGNYSPSCWYTDLFSWLWWWSSHLHHGNALPLHSSVWVVGNEEVVKLPKSVLQTTSDSDQYRIILGTCSNSF